MNPPIRPDPTRSTPFPCLRARAGRRSVALRRPAAYDFSRSTAADPLELECVPVPSSLASTFTIVLPPIH